MCPRGERGWLAKWGEEGWWEKCNYSVSRGILMYYVFYRWFKDFFLLFVVFLCVGLKPVLVP